MTSKRESQLTTVTDFVSGDLLTGLRSAGNVNFSYSSLFNAMSGLTSLNNVGDPLGVPLLDQPAAGANNFKVLESSKGIIATTSAQGGANLACNFTQAATGTKLIPDLNVNQYKIKTLQNGEGISISDNGDTLTFSATGVATPSNLRFISSEADFDNQTAFTITLTPGLFYQIGASFSTTKNIIGTGAVLEGLSAATTLTYTGTGNMFSTINGTFRISSIFLDCPSGTVFKATGDDTGNINHRINATSILVLNCKKLLEANGAGGFVYDVVQVANMTGTVAVSFVSTVAAAIWDFKRIAILGMTAGSVGFDLGTSVTRDLEMSNIIMFGDAIATAISGLANSGNISSGNLASVSNCNFSDFTNQLSGITTNDIRWNFSSNASLAPTRPDALASIISNATVTTIIASSTNGANAVKMAGTWVLEGSSHFTVDATGRITYNGESGFTAPLDVTVNVLMASGGTKNISAYLVVTGSLKRATEGKATPTSSLGDSCICHWQHTFVTNDYIEVWLENQSDTVDIIGVSGVMRVN